MNPSTEDMLNAIDRVNAKTIYILPNNKKYCSGSQPGKGSDGRQRNRCSSHKECSPRELRLSSLFSPDGSSEENSEAMLEAAGLIKTGQITYAVRDTRIDNKGRSTRGDIMGIGDSRACSW